MNFLIETYGCQMNKAESAAIERILLEHGWRETQEVSEADLVLLNTCVVRATAENRAWARISQLCALKKQRSFVLCITGCLAENQKFDIKKMAPGVDFVLGNFQKTSFEALVTSIENGRESLVVDETPVYQFSKQHSERGAFQAYIPISHGCDNFCTYCIVPYVRGRETARAPSEILAELDYCIAHNVREITLLGQNVNSYFWKNEGDSLDFADLLALVSKHCADSPIKRIRFLTSHPKDLSQKTIDVMRANESIAKHLHLCVQHGSNAILKAMNRKYTREQYLDLVKRLRTAMPDITLSTDILVGFPGETEQDIDDTLALMDQVQFVYSFMYYYNPRKGTPAATMPDQIPLAKKKLRLERVIQTQKVHTKQIMQKLLGKRLAVLVLSISKKKNNELLASSEQDIMVCFEGDAELIGSYCLVDITGISGNTFKGRFVQKME